MNYFISLTLVTNNKLQDPCEGLTLGNFFIRGEGSSFSNEPSEMDVARWCKKWDWMELDGYLRALVGLEHLPVLIRKCPNGILVKAKNVPLGPKCKMNHNQSIFIDTPFIKLLYLYILLEVREIILTLKNVNSDQTLGLVRCLSVWPLPC